MKLRRGFILAGGFLLLAISGWIVGVGADMTDKPFKFETYSAMEKEKGKQAVTRLLSDKFPVGTPIQDLVAFLTAAGAKCKRVASDSSLVFCRYTHPEDSIRRLFVQVDWVVIAKKNKENEELIDSLEIYKHLTGL